VVVVGFAELTGSDTGLGVADGVPEGAAVVDPPVPEPPPVVFCTTADTTWPESLVSSYT
jgi:hypothetical protein